MHRSAMDTTPKPSSNEACGRQLALLVPRAAHQQTTRQYPFFSWIADGRLALEKCVEFQQNLDLDGFFGSPS